MKLRDAREMASELRWEGSGVKTLWVDHFVQCCQLLHELECRCALRSDGYRYYSERMSEWEELMGSALLRTEPTDLFIRTQDQTQAILQEAVEFIQELLRDDLGGLSSSERFGLHLWVRKFKERGLSLWCSSDRAWRDSNTLYNVPISQSADWIAVHAFSQGTPVDAVLERSASRWGFVRGYPIFLDDAYWGRLPVGVVTLASSSSVDSPLANLDLSPVTLDDIYLYLHDVAAQLLNPRVD